MDELDDCVGVHQLLPELAAGAASGPARARVLSHIGGCLACRAELAELSRAADELLLLAPEQEPPTGFETRALAEIAGVRGSSWLDRLRARVGWIGLGAAVLVVVFALGASAALLRTERDRDLGARYRKTLAVANGQYLHAARIRAPAGGDVGQLFAYQGHPSWVFVTVTGAPQGGAYEVRLVTKDGAERHLGECVAAAGSCSAGGAIDIRVSSIRLVELTMREGLRLTAYLG
jgi:hypothetical protein